MGSPRNDVESHFQKISFAQPPRHLKREAPRRHAERLALQRDLRRPRDAFTHEPDALVRVDPAGIAEAALERDRPKVIS